MLMKTKKAMLRSIACRNIIFSTDIQLGAGQVFAGFSCTIIS